MTEKIDPYDILTKLVLGTLFACLIPVAFPGILVASFPKYPGAFATVILVAIALFTGEIIQAIASALQVALFWSFRGNVSETALSQGIKGYLTASTATRISEKLQRKVVSKATDQELFQYASHMVGTAGRVPRFNAQYGYHRGMFFMVLLSLLMCLGSLKWGAAASIGIKAQSVLMLIELLVLLLLWYRAKQWSCYFVREVLLTAEQLLDKNNINQSEEKEEETKETEEPEENELSSSTEDKTPIRDKNEMTLAEEIHVEATE